MAASATGDEGDPEQTSPQSWKVAFDGIAKIELATTIIHYELESPGLGERFNQAVHDLIGRIRDNPNLYQKITTIHRRAAMGVFPYAIYFAVHRPTRRILILNIHHAKRHPKNWRRHKPPWRK